MHALNCVNLAEGGRGKKGGLSAYAEALGKKHNTVSEYLSAARVLQNMSLERHLLLEKAKHLSAIHSLPESCWQEAVSLMLKKEWSAKETQENAASTNFLRLRELSCI